MFLGLPDPHPDPLVTSTDPGPDPSPDPAPDPSIIKQKYSKVNLAFYCFVTHLRLFTNAPDPHPDPDPSDPYDFRSPGSESGSIRQRYGSEDPDPYQNVTDPQHWIQVFQTFQHVI
jgi:hypothetical protein